MFYEVSALCLEHLDPKLVLILNRIFSFERIRHELVIFLPAENHSDRSVFSRKICKNSDLNSPRSCCLESLMLLTPLRVIFFLTLILWFFFFCCSFQQTRCYVHTDSGRLLIISFDLFVEHLQAVTPTCCS